jgi:hypothetical protein
VTFSFVVNVTVKNDGLSQDSLGILPTILEDAMCDGLERLPWVIEVQTEETTT